MEGLLACIVGIGMNLAPVSRSYAAAQKNEARIGKVEIPNPYLILRKARARLAMLVQ